MIISLCSLFSAALHDMTYFFNLDLNNKPKYSLGKLIRLNNLIYRGLKPNKTNSTDRDCHFDASLAPI